MAKKDLPLGTQAALSNLHTAIETWEKWRSELYDELAKLNAHVASYEKHRRWPPDERDPA